jgi:hypothetical protein
MEPCVEKWHQYPFAVYSSKSGRGMKPCRNGTPPPPLLKPLITKNHSWAKLTTFIPTNLGFAIFRYFRESCSM